MTKHITYACDICGHEFNTETGAEICEKRHGKIVGISSAHYDQCRQYPSRINVTFRDGETKVYQLLWNQNICEGTHDWE